MKKYDFITKKFLIQQYNEKSAPCIAKEIGCNHNTIYYKLIKFNILRRTQKEAQREAQQGKLNPNYIDGRSLKKHYCIEPGCNNEICYENWKNGSGRCQSCSGKRLWKNEDYRNKIIKKTLEIPNIKPNKPEKLLTELLNKLLPKEYKYVGNFKFWVEHFNPDFINSNGQKKIIELYGDYWHNTIIAKIRNKKRVKIYKKYGYETLIIWEYELKDLEMLTAKIMEFDLKK